MTDIDAIDALLPQTQCELCEYPGCRPYATAIVEEGAPIDRCLPGGVNTLQAIGAYLNQDTTHLEADLTNRTKAPSVVSIDESMCIGCTKCLPVCPTDAIIGRSKRMHTVITDLCTGCELCIPACPVDCIIPHTVERESDQPTRDHWRQRFQAHQERAKKRDSLGRQKHQALKQSGPRETSIEARQSAIEAALARVKERRND